MLRTASLFAIALVRSVQAQNVPSVATASDAVRVYLDCDACDVDYVRTSIRWVRYVRDWADADAHVLVTAQATGSGGTRFELAFSGRQAFAGVGDTVSVSAPVGATADAVRDLLVGALARGLVRYAEHTAAGPALIVAAGSPRDSTPPSRRDPWDGWVFAVTGTGGASGQQATQALNLKAAVSAARTTDLWKVALSAAAGTNVSSYRLDSTVTSTVSASGVGGFVVRSIGPHWSTGLDGSVTTSTYLNEALAARVAPALEYDLFPYAQASRRQCVLTYSVGVNRYVYQEPTIFGRLAETRAQQVLLLAFAEKQPWGTLGASIDGANYLDDLTQHHLASSAVASVRIARGLNLAMSAGLSLLHDQLYLPAGAATADDILLQRRQTATGYQYATTIGLSYTFGSAFNDVVNPRLAAGQPALTPGM